MSTPGTQAVTFASNERVLCYHGPLIYEAKVLKTMMVDEASTTTGVTGPHYFVHYKGWKQTCVSLLSPSTRVSMSRSQQNTVADTELCLYI